MLLRRQTLKRPAPKDYRLIHIGRLEARTGSGGPGELAWLWALAALLILLSVLRIGKRRH